MIGLGLSIPQVAVRGGRTLAQQVAAILAKYGTDAHVYLPGIGVINGLTAGNFLDSAGTTAATVDNPVGLVLDAGGNSIARRNLLTYSQDFNTSWTKGNVTVSTDAINAPDGTLTADKIVETSAIGVHSLTLTVGTVGAIETSSVYAKAGERNWIAIQFGTTGSAYYNVATGELGNVVGGTATISAANNGFYRCTFTGKRAGNTNNIFYVATANATVSYVGDITKGIYLWGAQLELGSSASEYQAITAGTGEWATGIHAIQATTANKPFLRKGAVNLLTYSDNYTNVSWTKLNTTIPTAERLHETAISGFHALNKTNLTPVGVTATISVEAKAAERNYIRLSDGVTHTAVYNLSTGISSSVAGTPTDIRMTALTDGWYRCSFTFVSASASSGWYLYLLQDATTLSYLGDITKGVSVRKAQLNTGTLADYAPTTSAPASNQVGNYAWQFDGSNDYFSSANKIFDVADSHCIVAGVSNAKSSGTSSIFSEGNTAAAEAFYNLRVLSNNVTVAVTANDGVTLGTSNSVPLALNEKGVVSVSGASATIKLRKNGGSWTAGVLMPTTVTLNSLGIGVLFRANGVSNADYFSGEVYPLVIIKGTVTDADLLILEKFVGALSGVSI